MIQLLVFTVFSLLWMPFSLALTKEVLSEDKEIVINLNNSIYLKKGSEVNYNKNGLVSHIFTTSYPSGITLWTAQNGEQYPLFCGKNAVNPKGGKGYALIWFHKSGNYQRGCHAGRTFKVQQKNIDVTVSMGAEVELFENGDLAYLESIASGEVQILNQEISLQERTELQLHENGAVYVATPELGQTLKDATSYKGLELKQYKPAEPFYFTEDGFAQQGLLAKPYKFNSIELPQKSQVTFNKESNPSYLWGALSPETLVLQTQENYLLSSKNIKFHEKGFVEGVQVEKEFTFNEPKGDRKIKVKKGDLVFLDEDKKIIRIEFRHSR